jgi:hypothetical protein
MFILTNSNYTPVACSKDLVLLYEKAKKLISKEYDILNPDSDILYKVDTGEIDVWGETSYSEYFQEYQMGWVMSFWNIIEVEEI